MAFDFRKVLFIGPDYKDHRGGIGAVLEIYAAGFTPFRFIPTVNYKNRLSQLFFFSASMGRYFLWLARRRSGIEIIHIHGSKGGSIYRKAFVVFIGKALFNKKIVYHIHAGAFEDFYKTGNALYKGLCRYIINRADSLIVLSDKWNSFFYGQFRVKELRVLRNPVQPVSDFRPVPPHDKLVFLFLGKIADHKGIFDLVGLIAQEQETLRGKIKLVVGGNHEADRLNKLVARHKIGDLVEYVGWVTDAKKEFYLSGCDFFILPTYYEAMPMTVLEALSHGKPVITTPVGSIPEIIRENVNGFLFEPGDMKQLLTIIYSVIRDRSSYGRLAENAFRSMGDFHPNKIRERLEEIYNSISTHASKTKVV